MPPRTSIAPTRRGSPNEVAELVVLGFSNPEIAARLFVGLRSVESNLTRIHGKLDVRSRTELVARLEFTGGGRTPASSAGRVLMLWRPILSSRDGAPFRARLCALVGGT